MRYRFWVGLAIGAVGTVTTLATTAELNHRAEQRALHETTGDTPKQPAPPRRYAPSYGESEFR